VQHTKTVKNIPNDDKIYQVTTKYTKWPQTIPKLPQNRYTNISRCKTLQNLSELGHLVWK
jgi:hypothetical protein